MTKSKRQADVGNVSQEPRPEDRYARFLGISAAPRLVYSPVVYEPTTDTMAIEIRPWPGGSGGNYGGEDAGPDLVIHYAPDGEPWLWEIEQASRHPEHIAAALAEMRRLMALAA